MQGRTENKLKIEKDLQTKIAGYPHIIRKYYYSLNSNEHTTKMRYINNVLRFVDYKYPDKTFTIEDLAQLTKFDIEEYMLSIAFFDQNGIVKEMKASTKSCIYSSLSSFFGFLADDELIDFNPLDKIRRPRIHPEDVVFLEPSEVKEIEHKILTCGAGTELARTKQENWKHRDFLLFHIPVINGIRIEALREINISDINLRNKSITVTEKGNITKDVYLDDVAVDYIKVWLDDRERLMDGHNDNGALFISNRRTRMTSRSIEFIIAKYCDGINGKHITPHKLRSTFGTNAYRKTNDIKAVAIALNHKTTVPTERYVKTFENKNRQTVSLVSDMYK